MSRTNLFHVIFAGLFLAGCVRAASATVIQLDQFGQGNIGGVPIAGSPINDAGPSGYSGALSYRLPFAGVQGDVFITDPNFSDLTLEIIRFNGDGTVIFYAGNLPGSRAFVMAPPATLYAKRGTTADVGLENNNTATYVPTAGQPGYDPSGPTYIFYNGANGLVSPPSIAMSFGAGSILLNASTILSFTVTNPNSSAVLSNVAFTDTLPAGLVVATPNGLSNSCGTVGAVAGSNSVTFATAAMNPGSCTVSINVSGTSAGVMNNSVQVTASSGNGNTANASLTVNSPPSMSMSFGLGAIPLNATTILTFTISNPNSTVVFSGVAFTDTLPAGLVVATPNGLSSTCGTVTAVAGSGSIALPGVALPPGSCIISVGVTGTSAGVKNNNVQVTLNGANVNTATASLTVSPAPPSISTNFGSSTIPLNGSTTLNLTLTNPNGEGLPFVAFTDTLPAGLVVATPSGLSSSCGTAYAISGTSSITLSGGAIDGASCTISVNVTGTTPGVKNNSVQVSSSFGNSNTANASLTVNPLPPSLTLIFADASIPLNGSTTLSFVITNPNSTTTGLTGIAFTDTLPAGLVVATPSGLSDQCGGIVVATPGSSSVSLTNATLNLGGLSCTVAISVTGTSPGVKNNSVQVSASFGNGNTATASLTVNPLPPSISMNFGSGSIPFNGSTTLSFAVTNPNSATALTGIAFTDTLPAGLVVATPNGLSSTCGGTAGATPGSSSVSMSGATLNQGSCTLSINVAGMSTGVKNNSVQVTASGGNGNTATATLTVNPVNVSNSVSVTQTGFGRNRATGIWSATMTVTNTSAGSIAGPVEVVLTGLPATVTMTNGNGSSGVSPYITVVPAGPLGSGASVSVTIQFQNPTSGFISYTPVTLSGAIF